MSRPLRLLFSAPVFPKISETFVTDQIIGLRRLGHRIDVFAPNSGAIDDPGLRKELAASIDTLFLPPNAPRDQTPDWLPVRRLPRWWRPQSWQRLGRVTTHPGFRRLRYPLKRGAALLDAPDYDAVVCHFGPAGVMVQQMRDIGLVRAPLVTVFHGYDITNHLERVPGNFYDRLFAAGDLFLPISERWRLRLAELGCPADRTRVQRLGTDLKIFTHEFRLPAPGGPLRLMSVARLVEKKGIEFGIRAVARLNRDGVDATYDIVGDGPLREGLVKLVADLGLDRRIRFLGARPHAEIVAIMGDHHVLLVPSVTDAQGGMEGIPVVIMEAMATGLLVVASRHSGIPEIVHHGENGLLASEKSDAELAECLRAALDGPDVWRRLVAVARERVRRDYDLESQNAHLADLLEKLE
jgi:colanic acid/amylovoran biosynthesis glycosyltransferase